MYVSSNSHPICSVATLAQQSACPANALPPAARVQQNKYPPILARYFYKSIWKLLLLQVVTRDTSYKSLITESELSIPTLVAELTLRRSVCQWYLYFLQVRFKSLVKVTVCTPNWVKSYKCLQSLTSSWSTTSRAQTHSILHTNSHNSQCCQHQQRLQPTSNNTTRTRHQAGDHAPTHSRSTKKSC